ncbi:MAG: gfo/Idh/MocA family oxidoreductase [Calditrichaeota bacterium]|nr:MAG: gfo/Idh/MocA family oxidoreductase [Calditrichota bacterium]
MEPVRLGMIGCGIAARDLHLPALQRLSDKFEIVAVCNISEPKAREFASRVGDVPYYLDYRELLAQSQVEAVDIALPIHLNYSVTRAALEAGKHVMVEKPLAGNLGDARKMLEFEQRFPQVMMVAENFRYHEAFRLLRSIFDEGEIGKPYAVFWDVFRLVDENNKYAKTEWRLNHTYPGGFITDGGVHNIAALRDLFGDFIRGSALTRSINPGIGEIDTLSLQFETERGVYGVLNLFVSSRGYRANRIVVLGSRGSVEVQDNRLIRVNRGDTAPQDHVLEEDLSYVREFEDFYCAIRENKRVLSTFAEAYRDLETMLTALERAREWRKLRFGNSSDSDNPNL